MAYCLYACTCTLTQHYNIQGFKRMVVGGKDAGIKDYPWAVLIGSPKLQKNGSLAYMHWNCGGSVISSKWVLTASHCLCIKDQDGIGRKELRKR